MVEELSPLAEWFTFGIFLDIDQAKLTQIECDNRFHGVRRCNIEVFNHWLELCCDPTWEKVANALDGAGVQGKARHVRERHYKKNASEGVCCQPDCH